MSWFSLCIIYILFIFKVFFPNCLRHAVPGPEPDWGDWLWLDSLGQLEDVLNRPQLRLLCQVLLFYQVRKNFEVRIHIDYIFSKLGIGQRKTPSQAWTWCSCCWRPPWTAWRELCCSALGSTCRMRDNFQARGRWLPTTPPSWSCSSSTRSSQRGRRMWHAGTWQVQNKHLLIDLLK